MCQNASKFAILRKKTKKSKKILLSLPLSEVRGNVQNWGEINDGACPLWLQASYVKSWLCHWLASILTTKRLFLGDGEVAQTTIFNQTKTRHFQRCIATSYVPAPLVCSSTVMHRSNCLVFFGLRHFCNWGT